MVKRVHVAAAVIRGVDGRILLARRADTQHQGGLWEFPGGKVEADESVATALSRELQEELGIQVTTARPLIKVQHDYPDKQVLLDVWEVSALPASLMGPKGSRWNGCRRGTCSTTSSRRRMRRLLLLRACPPST